MEKLVERTAVKDDDKWDIDSVYQSKAAFDQDFESVKAMVSELATKKDCFLKNAQEFKQFMLLTSQCGRLFGKLFTYAVRKSDEDKNNAVYQELTGKLQNLYQSYDEKTAWVIPKMIAEDPLTLRRYLKEEKQLAPFTHFIEDLIRYQGHTLTEEEERIISAYGNVLGSASETASYLMDADMRFGTIHNEQGEEVELTEANYGIFLRSKDRKVRRQAFTTLHQVFGGFKNTLASTLSSIVHNASISARLKNFPSSLMAALYGNNIPLDVYNNLIRTVHQHLSDLYEYFAIKKELLGVAEFHLYDSYVSVSKNLDKTYSFEEGKTLVQQALSVLGEEYNQILNTAFTDGWIDKYPNRGKRSGAYSAGSYDTKPFVLLNYTNTYNDVSTLAHELGHSMHSYFANRYNDYENADYPIFLAEIASTVNELLFSYYTEQQATSKEEKLAIINERLDTFKGTIFRQTMFAEFEKHIHELVDQGEVLTADSMSNYYYQLNELYFGQQVVLDEEIRYEYLRIPHFYTPFYVYQYATGLSIASYIVKNILEKTEGFKEKYLQFLKAGGSDYPLEVLKIIDVDLTDTKVFEEALSMFKKTVTEFKKISQEK